MASESWTKTIAARPTRSESRCTTSRRAPSMSPAAIGSPKASSCRSSESSGERGRSRAGRVAAGSAPRGLAPPAKAGPEGRDQPLSPKVAMGSWVRVCGAGLLTSIVLDGLWLGVVMKTFYRDGLAPVARLAPDGSLAPVWAAALPVYFLLVAGNAVFVLPRAGASAWPVA